MPYFLNCVRCNKDNKYSNLGKTCPKCDGTGRDWREDHELEDYHKWAGFGIDELKEKGVIEFVDEYDELKVFTYMDSIPTCSISAEIEEIRKSLPESQAASTQPSQIFCKHDWQAKASEAMEVCSKCGKEREIAEEAKPEKVVLQYNKDLHDHRYYFPNRCYACDHYSDSRGEPESGSDMIFCNIGGKVRADTGCAEFKADVTAECKSCWNLSSEFQGSTISYTCDLKGPIQSLVWGSCNEHVEKERTDEPLPAAPDAISKNKAFLVKKEYPHDPKIRKPILDAMIESGIRYVTSDEFSLDRRCSTCARESKIEGNYGSCGYHELGILCYSGDNPYGYDEKICEHYSRKEDISSVGYPKVYIDVRGEGTRKLNNNYHVTLRNMYCDVIESGSERVITTFSYTDRAPQFIQYNEKKDCIDLYFYDAPECEELSLDPSVSYVRPVKSKRWIDIDEDEMFEAIDRVSSNQREHDVYSGSNTDNCERCKFVERNPTYPDGSPTGLICSRKEIFVTANGCCDNYELMPFETRLEKLREWNEGY